MQVLTGVRADDDRAETLPLDAGRGRSEEARAFWPCRRETIPSVTVFARQRDGLQTRSSRAIDSLATPG